MSVTDAPARSDDRLVEGVVCPIIESSIDEDNRTVELDILVAGYGNKRDRHYYSPQLLQECADQGTFNGAQMYKNHLTPQQEADLGGLPRSVDDLAAQIDNTWVATRESDGRTVLRGRAEIVDDGIWNKVRRRPTIMGVSINGRGPSHDGMAEGRQGKIVEAIKHVKSVDWVSLAGAGGGIRSIGGQQIREAAMGDELDTDIITFLEADLQEASTRCPSCGKQVDTPDSGQAHCLHCGHKWPVGGDAGRREDRGRDHVREAASRPSDRHDDLSESDLEGFTPMRTEDFLEESDDTLEEGEWIADSARRPSSQIPRDTIVECKAGDTVTHRGKRHKVKAVSRDGRKVRLVDAQGNEKTVNDNELHSRTREAAADDDLFEADFAAIEDAMLEAGDIDDEDLEEAGRRHHRRVSFDHPRHGRIAGVVEREEGEHHVVRSRHGRHRVHRDKLRGHDRRHGARRGREHRRHREGDLTEFEPEFTARFGPEWGPFMPERREVDTHPSRPSTDWVFDELDDFERVTPGRRVRESEPDLFDEFEESDDDLDAEIEERAAELAESMVANAVKAAGERFQEILEARLDENDRQWRTKFNQRGQRDKAWGLIEASGLPVHSQASLKREFADVLVEADQDRDGVETRSAEQKLAQQVTDAIDRKKAELADQVESRIKEGETVASRDVVAPAHPRPAQRQRADADDQVNAAIGIDTKPGSKERQA